MIADGQQDVVGMNSLAVVGDADQFSAALDDVDVDPRRERIDAVLEQFFHPVGRSFDDLTGGDLVDHARIELLNARHELLNDQSEGLRETAGGGV